MTDPDIDERFVPPHPTIEKTKKSRYWIARIKVPSELHSILGSADKKRSLKTTDKKEAQRLLLGVQIEFAREFTKAARRSKPDQFSLQEIVQQVAKERLQEHDEFLRDHVFSMEAQVELVEDLFNEGYTIEDANAIVKGVEDII